MSREAVATAYTAMLNDDEFRDLVAQNPEVLEPWDLTDQEKSVLVEEAGTEVTGFAIGSGAVMGHLAGASGPPLMPATSMSLGMALNRASGLPIGSLQGPAFASDGGCCPWNKSII